MNSIYSIDNEYSGGAPHGQRRTSHSSGSSSGIFKYMCNPVKAYICLAFICIILYYGYQLYNKTMPSMMAICSNLCCVCITIILLTGICTYNNMAAWVCVIGMFLCTLSGIVATIWKS